MSNLLFCEIVYPWYGTYQKFIYFSVFFLECYFIGHTFAGQKWLIFGLVVKILSKNTI